MKEYGHTRNDTEYMVDKFGNRIIGGKHLLAMLYGAGVGGLASLGIGLLLIPKPTPKGLESFVSLNKMARDIDEIISGVPLGYFNQDLFRDNFLEFLPE